MNVSMPLLTINATYIGSDPLLDKMIVFKSQCVPRVGECFKPQAGAKMTVVTNVVYKSGFIPDITEPILIPTIILQDAAPQTEE